MKTSHVLMVGAVAGAWIFVSLLQQQHAREELQSLSSRVAQLARAQREQPPAREGAPTPVVREVRVEVPVPTPAAAAPVAAQEPAPASTAAHRALPQEVVSERIEEHFGTQPSDTAWARNAEHAVTERVRAALPEYSRFRSAECRASMCRIETEHVDLERSINFMRTAFMTPERQAWDAPFLTMRSEDSADGKVVTVTYLAREGMELPMKELLTPEDPGAQALQ